MVTSFSARRAPMVLKRSSQNTENAHIAPEGALTGKKSNARAATLPTTFMTPALFQFPDGTDITGFVAAHHRPNATRANLVGERYRCLDRRHAPITSEGIGFKPC